MHPSRRSRLRAQTLGVTDGGEAQVELTVPLPQALVVEGGKISSVATAT